MRNRARRARVSAGLSLRQAAKLLGVTDVRMGEVERLDEVFVEYAGRLADLYRVSPEWMSGDAPLRDYDRVAAITGAENLSIHDRDIIAELVASTDRTLDWDDACHDCGQIRCGCVTRTLG